MTNTYNIPPMGGDVTMHIHVNLDTDWEVTASDRILSGTNQLVTSITGSNDGEVVLKFYPYHNNNFSDRDYSVKTTITSNECSGVSETVIFHQKYLNPILPTKGTLLPGYYDIDDCLVTSNGVSTTITFGVTDSIYPYESLTNITSAKIKFDKNVFNYSDVVAFKDTLANVFLNTNFLSSTTVEIQESLEAYEIIINVVIVAEFTIDDNRVFFTYNGILKTIDNIDYTLIIVFNLSDY